MNDLSRLLQEGEEEGGDERSKRICMKLESWLKRGMENATKKFKRNYNAKTPFKA